jgi:hypothetical protein
MLEWLRNNALYVCDAGKTLAELIAPVDYFEYLNCLEEGFQFSDFDPNLRGRFGGKNFD